MLDGINGMKTAKAEMTDTISKMTALKDAVPGAFETAKNNYLAEIDINKAAIEMEFQKTLDVGFKQMYLTVTIASVIGLLILSFYKKKNSISAGSEQIIN